MSGLKVTRIATAGQELGSGYALDATYAGDDADITTGLPLDGLLDVNAPAPDDQDVLTWDDAAGEWIAQPGGGGPDVELVTVAATGATETIDVSVARTYDLTLTADCTFTLTGAVTDEAWFVTLLIRQDGTGGWDVTWPGSVQWAVGGGAPTIDPAINALTVVTLGTVDGGTVWLGFPTGGGGASIGATVEDETTWGITPDAGASTEASAADHTHGTPANPVSAAALDALGVRGELVVADGTSGPAGIVPSNYVEMTTPDSTTSASLEDITGASTTITLQRTSHVAAWMSCHVSASATATLGLAINFNGTDHDVVDVHLSSVDEGSVTVLHRTATELAPGTYTVKGRMQRISGGGTPSVDRVDLLVTALATTGPVLVTTDDETDYVYADLA